LNTFPNLNGFSSFFSGGQATNAKRGSEGEGWAGDLVAFSAWETAHKYVPRPRTPSPAKQHKFKELPFFPDIIPLRGGWISFSWSRMQRENLNQPDWAGGKETGSPWGADGKC